MKSIFKIRERLNSTKLKILEKGGWDISNSSAIMEKVTVLLDISATTAASTYSANKAAIDLAHAAEDYA